MVVNVRDAGPADVAGICRFGETHIRPHYTPLIGARAADAQVRRWWTESFVGTGVAGGMVVVAEADGQIVGVGQRGADHVVYKLYVDPRYRGQGLGPRLLDALAAQLPAGVERLAIEHFVANERAGAFYEREGYTVDRIEAGPPGNPGLGTVWRSRRLRGGVRAAPSQV